jgi:hypothetical protein
VLVLAQTGRLRALTKRAYPALGTLVAWHPLRALYSPLTLWPGARRRAGNVDVDVRETLFDSVELDGEESAWVGVEQAEGQHPEATPLSPNRTNTFGVKAYGTR